MDDLEAEYAKIRDWNRKADERDLARAPKPRKDIGRVATLRYLEDCREGRHTIAAQRGDW